MNVIIWTLAFVATLSPALTLTALWQTKEWRYDRLREYVRGDGLLKLWGGARPAIALAWLLLLAILPARSLTVSATAVLALLGFGQLLLRKQRLPVWTAKAKLTTALVMMINAAIVALGYVADAIVAAPLLALAQPVVLAIAWITLMPIDKRLKSAVMNRARKARAQHEDLVVIGITGSVGKTTTKELLGHVLSPMGAVATPAHVNTEMGVSKWLTGLLNTAEPPPILIVEMGAYRKGEIALLCSIARPSVGVVTYVGTQHIGLFGSQKNLQDAKGEMVTSLPDDGHAFLNGDNELTRRLADRCPGTAHIVSTGGNADLEAFDIEETANGIRFTADGQTFDIPLTGTHNVTNVLLCIAVARHVGMPTWDVARRLKTFVPPHKTFAIEDRRGVTVLNDTHNASQASFKAAVAWAKGQPHKRKVLLTDGLIELGADEERVHRELGGLCSGTFDRVVFLNRKRQKSFAKGYENTVELLAKSTPPVDEGTLLVCEGRMNDSVIDKLIP